MLKNAITHFNNIKNIVFTVKQILKNNSLDD